ncbi:MAG: BMP family ABC transporter substrate-binding protein [Clostridia bacterium]|nr:BMP family ABC transporter substrate-binding protein [Clostridia bacterium]
MRKFISVLLIVAMTFATAMVVTSCGSNDGKDNDVTVVISTSTGDKSFNDSAKAGCDRLNDEGYKAAFVECGSNSELFEQNLKSAAESSRMVVAVGSEFTMLGDVCNEYPDVMFAWVDNCIENPENYPNLINISYAQNEGSYLVGYIAAKESKTGTVGIVGGMDIPVINDFIVGFEQGAKDAGAKAIHTYTNDETWSDADKGLQCAQDLHSKGADVIFQACGGCGVGITQGAKDNGYMVIGVDADQRQTMADYADYIYCSMVKEVGNSIFDLVVKFIDDEQFDGGSVWNAGLEGGYVGVAYGAEDQKALVSDEIQAGVKDIQEKIASGDIKVVTAL